MQKLSGRGMAFLEFDGHVVEYELQRGSRLWWIPDIWLQWMRPAAWRFRVCRV